MTRKMHDGQIADLSILDASGLIDRPKRIKAGKIKPDDDLNEAAA